MRHSRCHGFGSFTQANRTTSKFMNDDELRHELVEVQKIYTAKEFGDALQDVKVSPTWPHKCETGNR